jgi:hypothetical protein
MCKSDLLMSRGEFGGEAQTHLCLQTKRRLCLCDGKAARVLESGQPSPPLPPAGLGEGRVSAFNTRPARLQGKLDCINTVHYTTTCQALFRLGPCRLSPFVLAAFAYATSEARSIHHALPFLTATIFLSRTSSRMRSGW